jgi:outer membrane protein OmpA-like peptidoglycan-associated protein
MAFMGKNPFYNGVYVSVKENGIWTKPYGINASIVSEGNMDVVSLSPDGKQMLLVIADEFDGTIYMSYYSDGRWNPAEALDKPINSRYYESHACFSPDGESIYFTSNRTESTGAMDIFRCDLKEDGSYGDAVNLGKNINTPLNEETPMISPDGKRIYFSSQGHSSMGGFDIFYSDMQVDGSWSEPVNLGYPLNTTDDDFALDPTGLKEPGQALIFANAGEAQHPLFKFEIIDENATPVYIAFNELAPEVAEVVEPEPQPQPEPQPEPEPQPVLQPEPQPAPVPVKAPEKYLIRPVFFEFDSNALTADTKAKLDETAGIMARFPSLQVEITGHTDAVGSIEYNQALSERRARAVADYLAANGLSAGRLKVTGKSESEHVALNRTRDNLDAPEGRKLNRRVQFRVSVTPEVIVEMEPILVPEHLKIVE